MYISIFIYFLLLAWALFSTYYIFRLLRFKDITRINEYLYESIPSVFTTLGVLGTFIGIFVGLQDFDVEKIDESIPGLLDGMKTAFSTSIVGIICSLLFGKATKLALRHVEKNSPPKPTGELGELNRIGNILDDMRVDSDKQFKELRNTINGENENSLSSELIKLRNDANEQTVILGKVQSSLGGDDETSLLIQIQKLRSEQNDIAKDSRKNIEFIVEALNANNALVQRKFDEFTELLAKSNTEALVDVMKQATQEFNTQMKELIDKLVKENFQELNRSVDRMNTWQVENKEMIGTLTNQFTLVSKDISTTSESIKEITENTRNLTDENSHLTKLIEALQEVMINDTKYQEIVNKISGTVDTLKDNTVAFDETTNKLNDWVKNQMNFNDSVAKLLTRLEEIDKIKDINEVFWKNTKTQLNEGVSIIKQSSAALNSDLENINAEFYERLNDTLNNLDTLIQRTIQNYKGS